MAGIRTIGLTGFSRDDELVFRELFATVAGPGWSVVDESEAAVLLIDFDSMYGQMAWLKAQSDRRPIVAVTVAVRADTEFLLQRPITRAGLEALLTSLAAAVTPQPLSATPAAGLKAAPNAAAPVTTPAAGTVTAPVTTPAPIALPQAGPKSPLTASPRRMIDCLQPGALAGPVRLRTAEPPLLVDPKAGTYVAGTALKPLATHCSREIPATEWQPLTAAEFAKLQGELGDPQPLSRLRWLAGLCAFAGELCPDLADATRFKLNKWPQSEREYPKHFRIATALLKQFCPIDELTSASGATVAEITDFINACHAIGMIEAERPGGTSPVSEPKSGGLMNRLRGR